MNQSLSQVPTVGEFLLHAASTWGARFVYGVPGPATDEMIAALERMQVRTRLKWVGACCEAGAVFMADGFSRVSGGAGLCLTTEGPGAASSATGVAVAHADGVPLLLVVAECSERASERAAQDVRAMQLDSLAMFRSICGYCARLDEPASVATQLSQVQTTLFGSGRGASVLGISSDIADRPVPPQLLPGPPSSKGRLTAPSWELQFDALLQAERPLLFLGSGARRALDNPLDISRSERRRDRLVHVAERHNLPVATSLQAKGVFPESSVVSLGSFGTAENEWSRRYVHAGIDALTLVGSCFGEWTTGGLERRLAPHRPPIHVDARLEAVGRSHSRGEMIDADAADYLDALLEFAEQLPAGVCATKRQEVLRCKVRRGPRWLDDEARSSLQVPLKPQRVMSELQAVLNHHNACKVGANLFADAGNALAWAWQHLLLDAPYRFFCSGMEAPGWASAAVIGGKLARDDVPALALLSENELLVNGAEISGAAAQGVGAIWLVLVESESLDESPDSGPLPASVRYGSRPARRTNLVDFARSLGGQVHQACAPGEVVRRLGEAIESAAEQNLPQVLLVYVDGSESPVFPQGQSRGRSSA